MRTSIRLKILGLTLTPVILILVTLIGMTSYWASTYSADQLYRKVRADLSVAKGILAIRQQQDLSTLKQLSQHQVLQQVPLLDPMAQQQWLSIYQLLDAYKQIHQLDFVRLIPVSEVAHYILEESSLAKVASNIVHGEAKAGLQLISPQEMSAIAPELIPQMQIELQNTPRAMPTQKRIETRGLFIRTLHPVQVDGKVVAILDTGRLLNRNNAFVDQIRDLVYQAGTLPEGGIGTVTLFLDDTRISTNVPRDFNDTDVQSEQGEFTRALGTRVSHDVNKKVLQKGESWVDRAFVVNQWYISAYDPIEDFSGKRIGMLYTGFLEQPYTDIYHKTLIELIGAIAVVTFISSILVLRSAGLVIHPLKRIHSVVQAVKLGRRQRIGMMENHDEFSELAEQFDLMLDLLEERNRQIQQAAEVLEQKVQERTQSLQDKTQELQEHIHLLQDTRAQLVTKEKLAVLGELTAGIAHEINNPAAVILGNIDLLQAILGQDSQPVEEEIELIVQQVYRIRSLINNLLQYSRPSEYTQAMASININPVVEETLVLVRHTLEKQAMQVKLHLNAQQQVEANVQQLQQVLVNLIMNAANATEGAGLIEIETGDWVEKGCIEGVFIRVLDQGEGITETALPHIFDPFFTTRDNGTGLGLSVSYGIIRRYGGDIQVSSILGQGSTFTVYLRTKAELTNSDEATTQQLLATLGEVQRG
ncbi:two-component system, NtrC family, sensor kinase [Oceanospirillum multiglobuliferum]|uniref:histidine kinase n=1 Tax=Oceanospirillum multiglobuliferum TaxID=64969 RepID=A0A1T4R5R8_9GAMM|nr:HAMP domain-containing sensor histidine kinase [Oceanospirillum multiglobuliferum]OPX55222.1 hypothetical protein BTE48_09800 [Oceanospirillum multiglobuliferum]SKA11253.1 two-component system, NtrC family, sensor kinase [Oceanospirillum multiglobuliferum]